MPAPVHKRLLTDPWTQRRRPSILPTPLAGCMVALCSALQVPFGSVPARVLHAGRVCVWCRGKRGAVRLAACETVKMFQVLLCM